VYELIEENIEAIFGVKLLSDLHDEIVLPHSAKEANGIHGNITVQIKSALEKCRSRNRVCREMLHLFMNIPNIRSVKLLWAPSVSSAMRLVLY
jgi:hypothetical protein